MRRLVSAYKELRVLYEERISVRSVFERLETCNKGDSALEARGRMEKRGFDVFGLEADGKVYGYVEKRSLTQGRCGEYERQFLAGDIVAESTPLAHLLPILRNTERLFVLEGNIVCGIVTRADLQKIPVRMMLFGLISLLEMHLLRLIREYLNEDWKTLISATRVKKAEELYRERNARDEAIDLLDCLQFCDKRDLVVKNGELRMILGLGEKKEAEQILKKAEKLRDNLAHAQDLVAGSSWPDIIDVHQELLRCLENCEQQMRMDMKQT